MAVDRFGRYALGLLIAWGSSGSAACADQPYQRGRSEKDGQRPGRQIQLAAHTPSSTISTFALGQPVTLAFSVVGLRAGQTDLQLKLRFVDAMGRTVKQQLLAVQADREGTWRRQIAAPCQRMGFWRVFAALSNGVTLPKQGVSQRSGYLTYAVVPDPAERKLYSEKETFFGMNGLFSRQANVMPYLGLRWMYEPSTIAVRQYGYAWGQLEPDYPGQFAEDRERARAAGKPFPLNLFVHNSAYFVAGERKPWQVFSLPTLFYAPPKWAIVPGTDRGAYAELKPAAERHWRAYCLQAARAYCAQYPDREENIYQITWEPQGPGGDERLIRTYAIAYQALHEADPKALVIGPANSTTMLSRAWDERLLSKGLGKYLDGYSVHHYLSRLPNDPGDLGKNTRTKWDRRGGCGKSRPSSASTPAAICRCSRPNWVSTTTVTIPRRSSRRAPMSDRA